VTHRFGGGGAGGRWGDQQNREVGGCTRNSSVRVHIKGNMAQKSGKSDINEKTLTVQARPKITQRGLGETGGTMDSDNR